MKSRFIFIFGVLFLFLISCGEDGLPGEDGESYLALSWVSIDSLGGFDELPSTIVN